MKIIGENIYLTDNFYKVPHIASMVMTKVELKSTLKATDGWIFACDKKWNINSEIIGAGMFKVTLKED